VQSRISGVVTNVQVREDEAPAEPNDLAVQWVGRSLAASPSHIDNQPQLYPGGPSGPSQAPIPARILPVEIAFGDRGPVRTGSRELSLCASGSQELERTYGLFAHLFGTSGPFQMQAFPALRMRTGLLACFDAAGSVQSAFKGKRPLNKFPPY
jgi:hypothetical protein